MDRGSQFGAHVFYLQVLFRMTPMITMNLHEVICMAIVTMIQCKIMVAKSCLLPLCK